MRRAEAAIADHQAQLIDLAGLRGSNGRVGSLEKRVQNASRTVWAVLFASLSILAAVIGAWNSLGERLARMEAVQQVMMGKVDQ